MAHRICPGPHRDIIMMDIFGKLTYEDMQVDEALGLNRGHPRYVMVDASQMNPGLPAYFLDAARRSFFVNDNLAHLAIYFESPTLASVARMVAKVTRRKDKMSIHNSREAALVHLLRMLREPQLIP